MTYVEHPFSHAHLQSAYFFGEVLGIKAFGTLLIGLLVFLLLSFISSLYILDNSVFFFFNQIGLLQIYSPSM